MLTHCRPFSPPQKNKKNKNKQEVSPERQKRKTKRTTIKENCTQRQV
jgi:hypothetical protein